MADVVKPRIEIGDWVSWDLCGTQDARYADKNRKVRGEVLGLGEAHIGRKVVATVHVELCPGIYRDLVLEAVTKVQKPSGGSK